MHGTQNFLLHGMYAGVGIDCALLYNIYSGVQVTRQASLHVDVID